MEAGARDLATPLNSTQIYWSTTPTLVAKSDQGLICEKKGAPQAEFGQTFKFRADFNLRPWRYLIKTRLHDVKVAG